MAVISISRFSYVPLRFSSLSCLINYTVQYTADTKQCAAWQHSKLLVGLSGHLYFLCVRAWLGPGR